MSQLKTVNRDTFAAKNAKDKYPAKPNDFHSLSSLQINPRDNYSVERPRTVAHEIESPYRETMEPNRDSNNETASKDVFMYIDEYM